MAEKKDQVAKEAATDEKAKKSAGGANGEKAVKTEKPAAPVKDAKADNKTEKAAASAKEEKSAAPAKDAKAAPKAEKKSAAPAGPKRISRLSEKYKNEAVPALVKIFNYKNVNQVPKLVKITINSGLGSIKDNQKSLQLAVEELKLISGQKPVLTKAKKSVANFKVRQNMSIGMKVDLRGGRMYDFFDKLVSIVIPRVRDFRGLSPKSFDGRGNYAMGLKEQLVFPEISYDQIDVIRGYDICITTTAKTDEEGRELLKALGMPFKNA